MNKFKKSVALLLTFCIVFSNINAVWAENGLDVFSEVSTAIDEQEIFKDVQDLTSSEYTSTPASIKVDSNSLLARNTDAILEKVNASVRVEADKYTVFPKETLDVTKNDLSPYGFTSGSNYVTALDALITALRKAGYAEQLVLKSKDWIESVCGIGGASLGWIYRVNGVVAQVAVDEYVLQEGDSVVFYCLDWNGSDDTRFTQEESAVKVGEKLVVTLNGETTFPTVSTFPIVGAKILISDKNGAVAYKETIIETGEDGKAEISFDEVGEYIISAVRYKEGKVDITRPYCKVIVSSVLVTTIEVSGNDAINEIVTNGGQLQMVANVMPLDVTNKSVSWSILNGESYAIINSNGLITAKGNGQVTVKATAKDSSKKFGLAVINISGQVLVSGVTVQSAEGTTEIKTNGGQLQMVANVLPLNVADKSINWSITQGESYAKISSEGLLTATGNGDVTVRAAAKDVSNKYGELVIKISGQEIVTVENISTIIDSISNSYSAIYNDEWKIIELTALEKQVNKTEFVRFLQNNLSAGGNYDRNVKDIEKAIIALSTLGIDASNFSLGNGEVVNVIQQMANYKLNGEYNLMDVSGEAFALIAYDSLGYENAGHFTREMLIKSLVSSQNENGGWRPAGSSDIDSSAIVATALSPYYQEASVKNAIDKYINWISAYQKGDGTFGTGDDANVNSTSFTIIALSSLGINTHTDDRFIKNGKSAVEGLLLFKTQDNTFKYSLTGAGNEMATEQALRALICYEKTSGLGTGYSIYKFNKADLTETIIPTEDNKEIQVSDIPLFINVPSNVDATVIVPATGILPEMTIVKNIDQNNVNMKVASGTKVTSSNLWNRKIELPKKATISNIAGIDVFYAVKVGAEETLNFDKPVRITIPNSKDKKIGYIDQSGKLVEITNNVLSDSAYALYENDGKIIVGNDYVIWTKHFTTFVAYSVSGSNGGSGSTDDSKTVSISVTGDSEKGVILSSRNVVASKDGNIYDILKAVLDLNGITFEDSNKSYIKGIDGLYQFANGPNSGWLYYINGVKVSVGVADYIPKNGDTIQFKFTDDHIVEEIQSSGNLEIAKLNEAKNIDIKKIIDKMVGKEALSEWEIFVLSINGITISDKHFKAIENDLKEKKGVYRLVTDYTKLALMLKASGKAVDNFAGYNILEKVYNNENIGKQGLNGYVFSLIVLNNEESLPQSALWNKEKLIEKIGQYQNSDGGYSVSMVGKSDVDITAMTLCALAPFKETESVKANVNKALEFLKASQKEDGSFTSNDEKTSESIAQVIIALSALDINPNSDTYVKDGENANRSIIHIQVKR